MTSNSVIDKRKYKRFAVDDKLNIKVRISYMGEEIICNLVDVSLGGAGLKSTRIPFSLINNTILVLEFICPTHSFRTQAKVVYSHKDSNSPNHLRYGTEFSLAGNHDIVKIIETLH